MDPVVVALTFGAIFVVELPDKTFIATLVLSTKFRPLLVWIGVGLAFTVQTIVAVLSGVQQIDLIVYLKTIDGSTPTFRSDGDVFRDGIGP